MADAEPPLKKTRVRKPIISESEKKRRKRERGRKEQKTRIIIGNQYERWGKFKKENGLLTDRAVAQHLLDNVGRLGSSSMAKSSTSKVKAKHGVTHTTPLVHMAGPSRLSSTPMDVEGKTVTTPSVSEVSSRDLIDREKEDVMSGVESLASSTESDIIEQPLITEVTLSGATDVKGHKIPQSSKVKTVSSAGRNVTRKQLTESFIDPFNLSIEISDEVDSEEDEDKDEDYEPSFCLTAVLPKEVTLLADDVAFEEIEFNLEADGEELVEETEDTDTMRTAGIPVITSEDDCTENASSVKCVVFLKQLLALASYNNFTCPECKDSVHIEHSVIGSAVYIKWICGQKHTVQQWCSQPQMNRKLHTGDFLICSTILSSGNNFSKMHLWAKQLNLMFPLSARFHAIQRCYMIPAIETAWTENVEAVRSEFHNQDIVLMGDGRNDSPGHCAQYCSYTLMEYQSKKIVALHTIDKRQTERKSVNMERRGFKQALNEVKDCGLSVKEVVTDAHLGISSVMSMYLLKRHNK